MIFNKNWSIRKQLILLFISTTILANIIVGQIALHKTEEYFYNVDIDNLKDRFDTLSKSNFKDEYRPEEVNFFKTTSLKVWNVENGEISYKNSQLKLAPNPLSFQLKDNKDSFSYQWKDDKDDNHYLAASFYIDDSNTMVIATNVNSHVEFCRTANSIIFWFTMTMSLLATLYSTLIVTRCLRPLKKFEDYLSQVRPGKLNIRIPTNDLPTELKILAVVQNSMLDRLDQGFTRLSDFTSDIAHELRTPLTNMSTQTQVVLSTDRKATEYHEVLCSNLEELERISKTINDTLYLAQADNDLLYQNKQDLDLHEIISQLVEYNSILAEDKDLDIKLEGAGCLFYDKLMFQRAINNLLSNAIRHSSSDTTINIDIKNTEEILTISIANSGATIGKDTLPFIFDRFYRGNKSREYDKGFGAGLGLAITKSIIESCGGTITAESEHGITKFEINIPNIACTKFS